MGGPSAGVLAMRRFTLFFLVSASFVLASVAPSCAQAVDAQTAGAGETAPAAATAHPAPEAVLRQMTNYLAGLPTVSFHIEHIMHLQLRGADNELVTKVTARLERPQRLAMIVDEGALGATFVSDGKQLVEYLPALNRYTVKDAPDDLAKLATSHELASLMMGGLGGFALPVGGDASYDQFMKGVTSSEYVGLEKLGDVMCHHCHFVQPQFDWDIWIEQGDRPVVRKLVPDLSKELAKAGDATQGAKLEMSIVFSDWNFAPKFTDADFAFTPPSGAQKVEELFGRRGGQEERPPNPLLGRTAPPFKTVDLQKQEVDLGNDLGKHVVILDFWATWCGPCCEALPIINDVATKYKDRGVVFYAVNLRDEADTITEFLKSKKLDVPVVLDADGTIGDLYRAEAIPQTVLIGKEGKVQVVHVGLTEGLADELSKQLDDLLDGKDLASATLAEAKQAHERRLAAKATFKDVGAQLAWTVANSATGVAAAPQAGVAIAIGADGRAAIIDASGKTQGEFKCDSGGIVRLANLAGDAASELVTFQVWGQGVSAYSATGEPLWSYPGGDGIDDVCAADLDGDGFDEIVIGYNGGSGIHVLDHQGKLLWKFTDIANVWHVAAGDFDHDGKTDVVTTSAKGDLNVFDKSGHQSKQIGVSFYADMVRMTPANGEQKSYAIATGSGDGSEMLAAVDFNGGERWKISLPKLDTDHIDDVALASTAPWAAVGMRGGLIHIVDLESRQIVARVTGQGMTPQLTWLPRPDKSPLLLVATSLATNAFEIKPTDVDAAAAAENEQPAADAEAK
jgi:peroxiredoxin